LLQLDRQFVILCCLTVKFRLCRYADSRLLETLSDLLRKVQLVVLCAFIVAAVFVSVI